MDFKVALLCFCLALYLTRAAECGAGIDVSQYQGSVNWTRVKDAGITFGIARATFSNTKRDPYFVQNWNGMKENGITPAAYHFFTSYETAESQATLIKSVLSSAGFDQDSDILAIDVENSTQSFADPEDTVMAQPLNDFLGDRDSNISVTDVEASTLLKDSKATVVAETLNDLLGNLSEIRNIYIYTNNYYWENGVAWSKYDFSKYNLWIAHWTKASTPKIPTTWKHKGYSWWQYSDTGRVDGISGSVDLDRTANTSC